MIDARKPLAIVMNRGKPLLKTQELLLRSTAYIRCIFGGWRSGKTTGCALAVIAIAVANPWRAEYGSDRPYSLVIGYTRKVLEDSAYREIKRLLPAELIRSERHGDVLEIELTNGHLIKFRTARGSLEGASACAVWLDEAHLLPNERLYLNYQMRASDALGKRFAVFVSGLPESGWLQDTFDRPEHQDDPTRLVIFASTADNHYCPPHVIDQFRKSVSQKTALKYLDGRWMPRDGVIYFEWDPRVHLVNRPGDREVPVHLGVDIGNKGAILFFQQVTRACKNRRNETTTEAGLHVIDELLPENKSTEAAMRDVEARGWKVLPGVSKIFVDPTTRSDEFNSIRRVFGDAIEIVKKHRSDRAENVEYGHDAVNAALRDVDGNVRLTVYSGLPHDERSLLSVITRYHRGPDGKPVRDDKVDHVLDALRYPVAHFLPLRSGFEQRAA